MSNIRHELFQKPTQTFGDHLSIEENYRILFSGRFGIEKTTFLNHYFKENKDRLRRIAPMAFMLSPKYLIGGSIPISSKQIAFGDLMDLEYLLIVSYPCLLNSIVTFLAVFIVYVLFLGTRVETSLMMDVLPQPTGPDRSIPF